MKRHPLKAASPTISSTLRGANFPRLLAVALSSVLFTLHAPHAPLSAQAQAQGASPASTGVAPKTWVFNWTREWEGWQGQDMARAGRLQFVPVADQTFKQALQIQFTAGDSSAWTLRQILQSWVPKPTAEPGTMMLRVWLRARAPMAAPLRFYLNGRMFERRTNEGVDLPSESLALTTDWKLWTLFCDEDISSLNATRALSVQWSPIANGWRKAGQVEIGTMELSVVTNPTSQTPQLNIRLPNLDTFLDTATPATPDATNNRVGIDDVEFTPWGEFGTGQLAQEAGRSILFLPFSGEANGLCRWNLQSGVLERTIVLDNQAGDMSRVYDVSPDGRFALIWTGNANSGTLGITDLPELNDWRPLRQSRAGEYDARFCGTDLIVLKQDERVELVSVSNLATETFARPPGPMIFSADGQVCVQIDVANRALAVFGMRSRKVVKTITNIDVSPLAWYLSSDGNILAGSNGQDIKLWNLADGLPMGTISDAGDELALSTDGRYLAISGGRSSDVRLYSTEDSRIQMTLPGHHPASKTQVLDQSAPFLYFLPDGRLLVSFRDGLVQAWHWATPRLLASMLFLPPASEEMPPRYATITPQGYYNCSSEADELINFFQNDVAYKAEQYRARYCRPDYVIKSLCGENVPNDSLKGTAPPLLWMAPAPNEGLISSDKVSLTLHVEDDGQIDKLEFFINGKPVEAIERQATTARRPDWATLSEAPRAISADSRSLDSLGRHNGMNAEGRKPARSTNLRPVMQNRAPIDAEGRPFGKTLVYDISLPPGENAEVQVMASDTDGLQSLLQTLEFRTTSQHIKAQGNLLGLCIGVSRYANPKFNLRYAHADAIELAQALIGQRGYVLSNAEQLTDASATRKQILERLDNLIEQAGPQDTVLLLLAGHGQRTEKGEFYFATYDIDWRDPVNTSLPWSLLSNRLRQLATKSKRVIVLLDACRSGSAGANDALIRALEQQRAGVLVFAASDANTDSKENSDWKHGAFTKAILEAIRGDALPKGAKDLTVFNLMDYVVRRVKELTKDKQKPTIPPYLFTSLNTFLDTPLFFPIVTNEENILPVNVVNDTGEKGPEVGDGGLQKPHPENNGEEVKTPVSRPITPLYADEFEFVGEVENPRGSKLMLTLVAREASPKAGVPKTNVRKPQKREILVTEGTLIMTRGKEGKRLKFTDLRLNDTIHVVGPLIPSTRIIKARVMWVFE